MENVLRSVLVVLLSSLAAVAAASTASHAGSGASPLKAPIRTEDGRVLHAVILREAPLALQVFAGSGKHGGMARKRALAQDSSVQYRVQLKARQSEFVRTVAEKIGRVPVVKRAYQLAVNAMIMPLSHAEAMVVRELPDVADVHPVMRRFPQTDRGPRHIGAPAAWNGEIAGLPATQGEGMIIGVIDTGIRPEHPSFADVGDDGYDHDNPLGSGVYLGDCALPEAAHYCNDKLIGIVSFPEITDAFGDDAPPYGIDYAGHGTHVASIAAGNVLHDVPAYGPTGVQGEYAFPEISGVAPHANIVSYQICYQGDLGEGCDTTLTVAAVEHAIENGVDVLNYSIGGYPEDPWYSIDAMAFLSARAAGIHVATSVGNEGPLWRTAGSPAVAPWLTSVAAYTHDRAISDITLGNFAGGTGAPAAINGKGVTAGIAASIVRAADHGDALCLEPFPPGTFAGEIVVCERGGIPRVDKGVNVLAGGAGGMVLMNVDPAEDDLVADFHALPAIHVDRESGEALLEWLGSGMGHTAEISATVIGVDPDVADHAGTFSSRGPAFPYADMLSPHVAAPGVLIYGAFSEDQRFSAEPVEMPFTALDGTSMASPHVAGALALLAFLRPEWTPAEMQSALMLTSVSDTRNDLGEPSVPFDQGAGRIDLAAAANAAFVMDVSEAEYLAADPAVGGEPGALNLPSLSEAECLAECSWTRRLRATQAGSWTVTATVDDPDANVSVEPAAFTVAEGEVVEISVRMTLNTDIAVPRWTFGEVRLVPAAAGIPEHHLPIAAAITTALFPFIKHVEARRLADSQIIDGMQSRASDALDITARAVRAVITDVELGEDSTPEDVLDNPEGNTWWKVFTVASEDDVLFVETLDVGADVDLFIGRDTDGNGKPSTAELEDDPVCVDGNASGFEICIVHSLAPGDYWVLVHNFFSEPGTTITQPVFTGFVQGDGVPGVAVSGPASVTHGEPYEVRFAWDMPMDYHEVVYALVSVGDDDGSIGNVPVRMERLRDDVRLLASEESVPFGDPVTYTVRIETNLQSNETRDYVIELDLPPFVFLESIDGEPRREGERIVWNVTQEPFGLPQWINFTVRPHERYRGDVLGMEVQHRLANDATKMEKASAIPVRLSGRSGGGSELALPLLLLLLAGMRRCLRR